MVVKSSILFCLVGIQVAFVNCGGDSVITFSEVAEVLRESRYKALASISANDALSAIQIQEAIAEWGNLLDKINDADHKALIGSLVEALSGISRDEPSVPNSAAPSASLSPNANHTEECQEILLEEQEWMGTISFLQSRVDYDAIISNQLSSLLEQTAGENFELNDDDSALLVKALKNSNEILDTINDDITSLSPLLEASTQIEYFYDSYYQACSEHRVAVAGRAGPFLGALSPSRKDKNAIKNFLQYLIKINYNKMG